nr:hypothetical protein [Tanacetum cinerariifolium]
MATIDKSSTLPYDSAPWVTSPVADEGSMQQIIPKLTALSTSLQRQLLKLTAKFQSQEVEINRRSIDEGEAATKRISDDSEGMVTVLTSMDAATVLASGVVDVPTGIFAIVVTPYRRRKGKEVMVESETPKKQKVQEQIDAQVTRELEEKLERKDQRRKPMSKKQKMDYYMVVIKNNLGWKVKDFMGMTFKEVEAKFNSVWKQMEDFISMGSKEESKRIKRKGLSLEHESAKKQKTSEEVLEKAMSPEEGPEEKVKEMMHLVLIEEVYVEALQVKHPIIDWKVYTKGQRSY